VNFERIQEAMARHGIDAGFEETGELAFATAPHQAWWIPELVETARRYGWRAEAWGAERARREVHSPTYHGAAHLPDGRGTIDPARLAWGLARAARDLGVHVRERSPVVGLERDQAGVVARTHAGRVNARRAILATSAFPPLVKAIKRYVVPVYDYVLVTEPLPPERREALGWRGRQGLTDLANQFHYYRLTSDDRVLWGGYDAVYNFRNGMGPHLDERPATFELLATHFFETFPQLEGVRFTHRWGGAIDTSSRFSVMRWSGRSPSPSRPSRFAGSASRSPAAPSPRPTAARAAAAPGSGRSTGSGWASTAENGRQMSRREVRSAAAPTSTAVYPTQISVATPIGSSSSPPKSSAEPPVMLV
jgi:glycine/D-amino acid oxidase-like deaminating enzyme